MTISNHVQIIGNKVYYKMELVATLNEFSMTKVLDDFKTLLVSLNSRRESPFSNQGHNHD